MFFAHNRELVNVPVKVRREVQALLFFGVKPHGFWGKNVILPPFFGCVDRLKLQDGFSKGKEEPRVFSLMDLWPMDF